MLAWAMAALLAPPAAADPQPLSFSDGKWDLKGERTAVATVDGREALQIETGWAYRRDVQLQDGAIEFDVMVTRRRSFVYVTFRMADDREYEDLYLRPHKSGLPDAVQYAPVFQGQSAWQLYHGPGGTAAVDFEPGQWTHVKLVLQGPRAALFLGTAARPVMVVPRLGREPRPGYFAFRCFIPPDTPGSGPGARISNVVVRTGPVDADFGPPAPAPSPEPGAVKAWSVSRAFATPQGVVGALPDVPGAREMQVAQAGPDGLLELHRFVKLPEGVRDVAAVARLRVRAAEAGIRRFDLGFSDTATVFLNGKPLYRGVATYSFDRPRREGLIEYNQATVFLPLSAGDNELAVLVSDSFGGWGLMGRFVDPGGLSIEPR